MDFTKAYDRDIFLEFLKDQFLPDDFVEENQPIDLNTKTKYIQKATRLGISNKLDLVVYEVKHTSVHDARVGLSKESFRLLFDEWQSNALVLFVPVNHTSNYRFSLIKIELSGDDHGKIKHEYSNPHRYSYFLGKGVGGYTPNKFLIEKGRVVDMNDLQNRFSTEVLTKDFYNELSDWYAWAINIVAFPNDLNDKNDDTKYNTESVIRLITRLIFVWFLKQRKLVPEEFFDEEYIRTKLLKDFDPHNDQLFKDTGSSYYKAILQNLFFAMLNSPITPEGKDTISERKFKLGRSGYDNNKLMRYHDKFSNPDLFLSLSNKTVPFLNGGLFECLDDKQSGHEMYLDGFSDRRIVQNSLIVPDYLFFGDEVGKNIDLSEYYNDNKKKKVSARGIIDILKRYNFTIEENTPFDKEVSLDPELLGKVFENLLASFNPETKITARNQTGSFYTPREIVQYMVDESLVAHLKHTVSEKLEPEYRKLVRYTDEEILLTSEQKKDIMMSLYHCKILDPACGSGAYPMGMLQQMVHILAQLDPDNVQWKDILINETKKDFKEAYNSCFEKESYEVLEDINHSFDDKLNRPDYARKLYLIENCIFGVDIQPIAIQISKLRFFISLIVDQKINTDPTDNFGIRPLPNLEAKFVAANTLVALDKKEATLFDTEEIKRKEELLKEANHKIFSVKSHKTKSKWKERVSDLRSEIAEGLKQAAAISDEEVRQLISWDMFDQNVCSPFFDSEWMFGITDGFDIVIGNPPYIQLQTNHGELAKLYKKKKFKSFAATGDIYCLFYERGCQLLKHGAHLCYITSNKWMRAGYGKAIRHFLYENTNPKVLLDFAGVKVFESATVDTNILLFAKEKYTFNTLACEIKNTELNNLSDYVQQNANKCVFKKDNSWIILTEIEQSIKSKIEAVGTPLKDWDITINYGIKTGYNEAFIIDGAKKDELIREDPKSAEIIRPILRGKDIKRYSYIFADKWLINVHNGIKSQGIEPINIDHYPAIKKHLDMYWDEIKIRTDQGVTPYNLRNCAYMDDFSKPVIAWQRITSRNQFCLTQSGMLILDSMAFISNIQDYKYILLSVLNSELIYFWIKLNVSEYSNTGFRLANQYVKLFPIPQIDREELVPFMSKINQLVLNQVNNSSHMIITREIDNLVYKLYNLNQNEIEYIRMAIN